MEGKVRSLTRPSAAWLAALLCLPSCTHTSAVEAAPPELARPQPTPIAYTPATQAAPAPAPVCPRVERAPRMYSGFAESIPEAQLTGHMHVVLDVIVPIQKALGLVFCTDARAPCRPSALLSIEVADLAASRARVLVQAADGSERELLMQSAREDEWHAEDDSLARFVAVCAR